MINFMEWYRNLRIVLYDEDKLPFLKQPISSMPVPPVGQIHEQTLLPKEDAPALHAIRSQRIQKNQKKKSHKAAKGNQRKGKAKMGYASVPAPPFAPKPKNPPTPKKDNPAKDAICHQHGELGH
nr:zinc finger, CCHC-type [Tanacetum cinerariifolium]